MVLQLENYRKSAPKGNDMLFIDLARRVFVGDYPCEDDLNHGLSTGFSTIIKQLSTAHKEDGEDGFMRVWDALTPDRPRFLEWLPLVKTPPGEETEQKKWGKYRPTTLLEMAQRPRPSDIIEGLFYEKTVAELFGPAGAKKSFLAFDWMAHIATGKASWMGHKIAKHGKCIYTLAEGADNFIKRALAWCSHHQVTLEKLSENLLLVDREIPLSNTAEISEYVADVGEFIHNVSPVVVVFDTLMRCSGGENINAPDVMAKLFDGANCIRRELDASHALIIHHEGKDSTKGSAGSFVLRANCDIVHHLTCDATTGLLTLSCNPNVGGKMKDKAEYPDMYLNTNTVYFTEEMERDDSSLVIVSGSKPTTPIKLTANRQALLDALPAGEGLRFGEWKQAVDKVREADGLTAMAKQTFIDNKDWLINQKMVRKVGTDDTEQNTYWRVQEEEEA